MRGRTRWILVVVVTLLALIGLERVAALGVQDHQVNGVWHGCPFDVGCADGSRPGNFNRIGRNYRGGGMSYSWVSIHTVDDVFAGVYRVLGRSYCYNCARGAVEYDTGRSWECKYATRHRVENAFGGHYMYTRAAVC